jgi:hypothetical protein
MIVRSMLPDAIKAWAYPPPWNQKNGPTILINNLNQEVALRYW